MKNKATPCQAPVNFVSKPQDGESGDTSRPLTGGDKDILGSFIIGGAV